MPEAKIYCGGCGKAGVGAFETCPKCGWHAPITYKGLSEAMRDSLNMHASMILDPSLRPPPKPEVN